MSVGGPLVVIIILITVLSKWLINSILSYFKINADISILDRSGIPQLLLCVFAGYSVLTYPNDQIEQKQSVGFGKLFHDWACQVLLKVHRKYTRFYRFFRFPPSQWKVLNFEACG